MATTTASISITNDVASSSVTTSGNTTLFKAASTEGMDTMTSVSKKLTSTSQVDLLLASSVSTAHNYVYISNSGTGTSSTEHIKVGIGNAGGGSPTDTEEIGRLYNGDWMFVPWTADSNEDFIITPSVATEMSIEYIVFS